MIKPYGLKTVEITGGGDPTMYGRINSLIELCLQMRLEVGMITNGVALKKNVDKDLLNRLAWVRVSTNSLEYVDALDLPEIAGTLGFSLVLHKDLDLIILDKIVDLSEKHSPAYIRIVPDCLIPKDQIDEVNELNKRKIEWVKDASGQPFFYQDKQFDTPERCWWGYFKPFLLHDCYVYPCSSVVLNTGADGKFHEKYRWYRMEDVEAMYQNKMVSFPTDSCDKCVFTGQNEMVDDLIHPNKMVNFI